MAEICPFKGIYYDTSKVDIGKVVTQPWDVITPEMREKYYGAHPHNIVRIIRGREMPGDNEKDNKFTRAGIFFQEWLDKGIFIRDEVDSLYVYSQRFDLCGTEFTRRGIIAAVHLEDYESKVILPHEHTFPKHNADRLSLLHETRANFGQLFMLYPDPEMTIPQFLSRFDATEPMLSVSVDGITHSIVRVADPDSTQFIVEQMKDKQLFIADGHHRYQTALNYRDEMIPRLSEDGQREVSYRMMTLVSMDDPSLTILPTHRVLRNITGFEPEQFIKRLHEFFHVQNVNQGDSGIQGIVKNLRNLGATATAYAVCILGSKFYLARLKDRVTTAQALPGNPHPAVRELDVTILHSLVLEKIICLGPDAQKSGEHILYYRDPVEAVDMVERKEGQVAFLLNPTKVRQVKDVALAGQVMPQKSTDFYPKLLTGLIMRKLDI
jgi:uncharacterized protein (DUF1015 family)